MKTNGHHEHELWAPTPDEADRIRERFLRDLSALDRKRHEVFDVKLQAKRHPLPIIATVGAFVVAMVSMILLSRRRARLEHSNHARLDALIRAWEHPERVAAGKKSEPAGKRVAMGLLGAVLKPFATKAGKSMTGQ